MSVRVAVFDYGSGNIPSVSRALTRVGASVSVTSDADQAARAEGVVIPGVGAFAACAEQLRTAGGEKLITQRIDDRAPLLGVCVGMQVLFEHSTEHGVCAGLGVLPGGVERVQAQRLPHMGWNTVTAAESSSVFAGIDPETRFYFVHSFAVPDTSVGVRSYTTYGKRFLAAVEEECLTVTQFHPEKSGDAGAQLLSNWVAACRV